MKSNKTSTAATATATAATAAETEAAHHNYIAMILRLDPADLKLLDMAAKKKKLTRTGMVRKLIKDGCRKIL